MNSFKDYLIPVSVLIAAVLIAGVIVVSNKSDDTSMGDDANKLAQVPNPSPAPSGDVPEVTDRDHVRGNPDASVTIIEYSDFECPFCSRFHPTVQQALDEYGDDVRWVYRHFPLISIHKEALPSAVASECVYEQLGDDGFWSFTDAMFSNQASLSDDYYRSVAGQLGVDLDSYDECFDSMRYEDLVLEQMKGGQGAGVTGTPGSFVNGVKVNGAVPYAQLQVSIDQALGR